MASLTQWTWTWANSGRSGETGRPGVLQSTRSQRVGRGLATERQLWLCLCTHTHTHTHTHTAVGCRYNFSLLIFVSMKFWVGRAHSDIDKEMCMGEGRPANGRGHFPKARRNKLSSPWICLLRVHVGPFPTSQAAHYGLRVRGLDYPGLRISLGKRRGRLRRDSMQGWWVSNSWGNYEERRSLALDL